MGVFSRAVSLNLSATFLVTSRASSIPTSLVLTTFIMMASWPFTFKMVVGISKLSSMVASFFRGMGVLSKLPSMAMESSFSLVSSSFRMLTCSLWPDLRLPAGDRLFERLSSSAIWVRGISYFFIASGSALMVSSSLR